MAEPDVCPELIKGYTGSSDGESGLVSRPFWFLSPTPGGFSPIADLGDLQQVAVDVVPALCGVPVLLVFVDLLLHVFFQNPPVFKNCLVGSR